MNDILARQSVENTLRLYSVLETARRSICCYSGDPCDCKYGRTADTRPSSEATGCPELRDLIRQLTGISVFNHGQSVEDDVNGYRKRLLSESASFSQTGNETP